MELGEVIGRMLASTCSVCEATDDLLDEGSTLATISLYARSKMEPEELCCR